MFIWSFYLYVGKHLERPTLDIKIAIADIEITTDILKILIFFCISNFYV